MEVQKYPPPPNQATNHSVIVMTTVSIKLINCKLAQLKAMKNASVQQDNTPEG